MPLPTRRWRATWTEPDGSAQSCTFVSRNSRVIAEMDFQAIRAYQNKPLPATFTLEEDQRVFAPPVHLRQLTTRTGPRPEAGRTDERA